MVDFIINVIKNSNSRITGQLKDILVHLPPQNMLMEKARGRITEVRADKTSFCTHTAKWSDLESDAKKWIRDVRNNRISVPKNYHFLRKRWIVAQSTTDFSGTLWG
jgi:hypothetical protein